MLSVSPQPHFLTDNIKLDGVPTKLNEKYSLFLHCISSFESSASYKNVKYVKDTATSSFITCCLFIIHNIFEILSTLIEKIFLSQIFIL